MKRNPLGSDRPSGLAPQLRRVVAGRCVPARWMKTKPSAPCTPPWMPGINYFDVAPAYGGHAGGDRPRQRAARGMPRARYFLSTKVGKYTSPGAYGDDTLDYSRARIRASLDESARRLGIDYFDIIHLHDIEYQGRKHTEWALGEGLEALQELKREGRIGAVSFGIYPMDLWHRIFADYDLDAALVHNHYCLNDTRLLELLPLARRTGVGVINGSPFASGLLTDRGPADWHPAGPEERAVFRQAAEFCRGRARAISKLALQFSSQNPEIPTTLFSSASPESVRAERRVARGAVRPALVDAGADHPGIGEATSSGTIDGKIRTGTGHGGGGTHVQTRSRRRLRRAPGGGRPRSLEPDRPRGRRPRARAPPGLRHGRRPRPGQRLARAGCHGPGAPARRHRRARGRSLRGSAAARRLVHGRGLGRARGVPVQRRPAAAAAGRRVGRLLSRRGRPRAGPLRRGGGRPRSRGRAAALSRVLRTFRCGSGRTWPGSSRRGRARRCT